MNSRNVSLEEQLAIFLYVCVWFIYQALKEFLASSGQLWVALGAFEKNISKS